MTTTAVASGDTAKQPPVELHLGPMCSGKCLAPSTLLLDARGMSIRADQVRRGTRLMGDDGVVRTVQSVSSGTGEMYRLLIDGCSAPLDVNIDHVLVLYSRLQRRVVELTVRELIKHHALAPHALELVSPARSVFTKRRVDLSPFLCGYVLGNYLARGRVDSTLCIDRLERWPQLTAALAEHNWALQPRAGSPALYSVVPSALRVHVAGTVQSQRFVTRLEHIGLVAKAMRDTPAAATVPGGPGAARELRLPREYIINSHTIHTRVLRGLLGGNDASRTWRRYYPSNATREQLVLDVSVRVARSCESHERDLSNRWITTHNLCEDLILLCRATGLHASMHNDDTDSGYRTLCIQVPHAQVAELLPFVLEEMPLPPPLQQQRGQTFNPLCDDLLSWHNTNAKPLCHAIAALWPLGTGAYCGFTLDGNQRFLLGSLMIAHNTTELVRRYNAIVHESDPHVLMIKHERDDRYVGTGLFVQTHNKQRVPAIAVRSLEQADEHMIAHVRYTLLVDEGHFFDASLVSTVQRWHAAGHRVHVAALDYNYKREPFKCVDELMRQPYVVHKMHYSTCSYCQRPDTAVWTRCSRPPADGASILVGGTDIYHPCCAECWPSDSECKK